MLAPAKLNLGLRVVGRRPDGYHEIDSLFVPIDLADELELSLAPVGSGVALELAGAGEGVPGDAGNLAVRAARAYLEAARLEAGVRLRLTKRIPVAAGLGGGSSDAGAVLRALDACGDAALGRERLAELALALGADVPFFLDPRPARVRGIGERIDPIGGRPGLALLLAVPRATLATADVYRAFDAEPGALTQPGRGLTIGGLSELRDADGRLRVRRLAELLQNDLEPPARRLCPEIERLAERLGRAGALGVGMSGSGPSVFGVFEDVEAARAARDGWTGPAAPWLRACRTLEGLEGEAR